MEDLLNGELLRPLSQSAAGVWDSLGGTRPLRTRPWRTRTELGWHSYISSV